MNESIINILAQQVTKTSKIQQLLLLGLTRREIADLVTNGNYGFVHNVYKKMLENGTFIPGLPAGSAPVIDYTFTHKFGVEIEAYNCTQEKLRQELREAGIRVAVESYNHDTRSHWKLVNDSSLRGSNSFELVSPILVGEDGLKELEMVCWVLDLCNAKVNESCGFHVHMDAADFDMNTWKNMALIYKRIEPVIDSFMPGSRRNNNYCKSLSEISESEILSATTISRLQSVFGNDRYRKLNMEAYSRHRTVEFRQHGGTTDFTKMEQWIRFLNGLITFAKIGNLSGRITLNNLPFLSEKGKLFFKIRTKKLANDTRI